MALVNVLSVNKQRGLWIQQHMTNGGKNTAGQRGQFFFLLQLKRLVSVLTELCDIFWNILDCPGVDCCSVTGPIIPPLQT